MYSDSPATPLGRDELKFRLVEYLKQHPRTQVANIMGLGIEQSIGRDLSEQESQTVLELIHEFIVANIVMTSASRHSTGWPWLSVTSQVVRS